MFSAIKNYADFSSVNSSIKYLSIVAFFTGVVLGYFFTIIVILQKYAGYSEFTIGFVASCFSFGLIYNNRDFLPSFSFWQMYFAVQR